MIGIVVAIFRRPNMLDDRREIYRFHLSANFAGFGVVSPCLAGGRGRNRRKIVVGIRTILPFNHTTLRAYSEKHSIFARHVARRIIRPFIERMYVFFLLGHFHRLFRTVCERNQQIAVFVKLHFFNSNALCPRVAFVALFALRARVAFVALFALRACIAFVAFFTLRSRIAFVAFFTLRSRVAFVALFALRTRVAFVALFALRALVTFLAFDRSKPFFIRKGFFSLCLRVYHVLRVHLFYLRFFACI